MLREFLPTMTLTQNNVCLCSTALNIVTHRMSGSDACYLVKIRT